MLLTVGLIHFCEDKFKHTSRDTLHPICICGEDIKTSSPYLFHCPDYLQEAGPPEYSQMYSRF